MNDNAQLTKACYDASGSAWMRQALVKPSRQNFAANLAAYMRNLNVSDAALARRIGVSPATVGRWRDGKQGPGYEDLDGLAKELGVAVADLFLDPTDARTTGMDVETALKMVSEAVKKTIEKDA